MLADARLVDALRLAVLVPLRLAVVLLRLALLSVCVAVLAVCVVVLLRLAVVAVCVVVVLAVCRAVLLRLAVVAICVTALLLLLLLLSSFFIVKMFLSPSNFSIHWSTCVLRFLALPLLPNDVSLYKKRRVVLRKTTCCFRENDVSFCGERRQVLFSW